MKSPFPAHPLLWGLIALLGIIPGAYTQDARPFPRYLELGLGATFHRLQDPAVSPMPYSGGPLGIYLAFEKRKPHSISRLSLGGDLGKLNSKNATELRPMASTYFQADLSYQYLRRLTGRSASRLIWFVGGRYRWHNSIRVTPQNDTGFISFFIANSINASTRMETDFQLFEREVKLGWTGTLPLLSHVIRPSYLNLYNYIDPEHDWLNERLQDSEWLTLNRFPGLQSRLELSYPIAGENQLRFAYEWEFYHYDGQRRVNAARHGFMIGISVRI
ncbi:MAG: hypothetical protein J5I94_03295 [Phaeodactylibacter sp.]|nr:hypothetical protein [Phaeodactylibacter sp.]